MVLVIATAGLVYELAMAAVASYVLGDSVTQFSTVIGVYLSALGLGAYLSKFITRSISRAFVDIELATAIVGGASAPLLFAAYALTDAFRLILYVTVVLVGTLVGLELPLLMRILKDRLSFRDLVARSLTYDYAGALLGSLAFSLLLLPYLGLMRASLVCGVLNAVVGLGSTWVLQARDGSERRSLARARPRAVVVTLILVSSTAFADRATDTLEGALYAGHVRHARESSYQRIVLTQENGGTALYLDGNLQFFSADEHRYHEALVHPAMASAKSVRTVFIGGGGDGLAAREVLKWPGVERVVLVDLDAEVTALARSDSELRRLNQNSLFDRRVEIINADAMTELEERQDAFDVILLDFPDPSRPSLGKLYSRRLYRIARAHLSPGGAIGVQATSPFFTREAFWCITRTIESAELSVRPYHVFVPSFGHWGFVLATAGDIPKAIAPPRHLALRFLTDEELERAFHFPDSLSEVDVETNRLNDPHLVSYYVAAQSRLDRSW